MKKRKKNLGKGTEASARRAEFRNCTGGYSRISRINGKTACETQKRLIEVEVE